MENYHKIKIMITMVENDHVWRGGGGRDDHYKKGDGRVYVERRYAIKR